METITGVPLKALISQQNFHVSIIKNDNFHNTRVLLGLNKNSFKYNVVVRELIICVVSFK